MNSLSLILLGLGTVGAQPPAPAVGAEPVTSFEWFAEVAPLGQGQSPYADFVLTPAIFDKARTDLADLRMIDPNEREVPYALRILAAKNKDEPLPAREFNRSTNSDRSVQASLDLGEKEGEYNAIDVITAGNDFRRRVRLEGSASGQTWSVILDKAYLVRYQVGAQSIDVHTLHFPASRLRYLRVHVFPESGNEVDKPEIDSLTVFRSMQVPGQYSTRPAQVGSREPVRVRGGFPGSAWLIDLGGNNVPCERLVLGIVEEDFARPYTLEVADPGEPVRPLQGGELRRLGNKEHKPLEVSFPEVTARRLRLTVTDYRNPPLTLGSVQQVAAAREVIFARPQNPAAALRLYLGNPQATAPHYDFAASLPLVLAPVPVHTSVGEVEPNPGYQPVPKPWSERWPWLVYVVLASASAVLLLILGLLAREAIHQHDARQAPSVAPQPER